MKKTLLLKSCSISCSTVVVCSCPFHARAADRLVESVKQHVLLSGFFDRVNLVFFNNRKYRYRYKYPNELCALLKMRYSMPCSAVVVCSCPFHARTADRLVQSVKQHGLFPGFFDLVNLVFLNNRKYRYRYKYPNEICALLKTHSMPCSAVVVCSCPFHARAADRLVEAVKQHAASWAEGPSFSAHLRAIREEFRLEKERAHSAAGSYSRASLLWSTRPDAVALVQLLRAKRFSHQMQNGADYILSALLPHRAQNCARTSSRTTPMTSAFFSEMK